MHNIINGLEARYVNDAVGAANNTDDNSTRIDMQGYDSVVFAVSITDSVATGVATLKIEENDVDSDTGMTAVTGASATKTCVVNDDINGTLLMVEYTNPNKRYVQGVITSATANIAFGEIRAWLRPRIKPAVQGATVSDTAVVAG